MFVVSVSSAGGQSILCHEEMQTVCLFGNHIGLGITLHSNTLSSDVLEYPPFIDSLEANSSAERYSILSLTKEGILPVATLSIALYALRRFMSASDIAPEVAVLSSAL